MDTVCAVILAAGAGTRMKSRHPKVLCEVLFRPMISWVVENCFEGGIGEGCAVLGHGADAVAAQLPESYKSVLQPERRGTGHAASMARDYLRRGGFSHAVVLSGDAPFLWGEELAAAQSQHIAEQNAVTVISAKVPEPYGYGRILRDETGSLVTAIVEERDASDEQRSVDEVNSGAYCFRVDFLLDYFEHMTCENAQGEYYLTDAVAYAQQKGLRVGGYTAPPLCALGANTRADLALLNQIANSRILHQQMENGVSIPFTDGVVIGPEVEIGPDTTILPGTILRGKTKIGADCEIGPNSFLSDAVVGDGCRILSSQIDSSSVADGARIGPMSNIRPDCEIGPGCKIGDFVELKNSVIGEKTSVAHLTYIGDSDVGSGCNFGCGVVVVNYDGQGKYRTQVGNDAFIGCNTNLVAPVKVGDRVYSAAGTTVTEDVPDDALVIGRARQVIKPDWVKTRGRFKKRTDR